MLKIKIIALSVIFLIVNASYYKEQPFKPHQINYNFNPLLLNDYSQLRDTIYTMKDYFIEVNLSTHFATLYSRSGFVKQFPISGGTDKIEKGIETKPGLYVLQWKSRKQYSVQFDSTVMLNWMSFNGGIGIHALSSNGYYKYLGKKNVSHGCVRMSREDSQEIFNIVERGTPVLVRKGECAVTIGFGKLGVVYKYYSYAEMKSILPERFENIYNGEYFINNDHKLLIDEQNITADGLMIGNSELIPSKQYIVPTNIFVDRKIEEKNRVDLIFGNGITSISKLTLNSVLDSLSTRKG